MGTHFGMVFEAGFSYVAVGLFLAGIVGVVFALIFFVNGGAYRGMPKPLTPAESEEARWEVGRRLSDLAPRTILLAEKLRIVDEALMEGGLDDERWKRVEPRARLRRRGFGVGTRTLRRWPRSNLWRRWRS